MPSTRITRASEPALRCSFCDKPQGEVKKLIAGPAVFICDECVGVCSEIIVCERAALEAADIPEGGSAHTFAAGPATGPELRCTLCGLPMLVSDGVVIDRRGVVCFGCLGEIEAALAVRRQ
jgi:hypothetical protein